MEVPAPQLDQHREEACPRRRTTCCFCGKSILLSAYMSHMPECPRKHAASEESAPSPCPSQSNGGEAGVSLSCPYAGVGCRAGEFNSQEGLDGHLEQEAVQHAQVRKNRRMVLLVS